MRKKPKITYLFGAGASYYSMPLVENFQARFGLFLKYIQSLSNINRSSFFNLCVMFKENVSNHLSFDTFFKKLFHQNDTRIQKFKAVLMIYFIYEQVFDFASAGEFANPELNKEKYGIKKGNIDPRYDALIAGLLEPEKGKFSLMSNVSFINWNYDTNLVVSIKNFMGNGLKVDNFFSRYENFINYFKFNDDLELVYLNGRVFHPNHSTEKVLSSHDLLIKISELINEFEREESAFWYYVSSIKFSWETLFESNTDLYNNGFLGKAIKSIDESNIIIIVGYSFPLYNRKIDLALFNNQLLKGKTVYVQDPFANDIIKILRSDFNLFILESGQGVLASEIKKYINVYPISNCKSFFVPSNLYQN